MRLPRTSDPALATRVELEVMEVDMDPDLASLEVIELECLASLEVTLEAVFEDDACLCWRLVSSTPLPHLERTPAQSVSLMAVFTVHNCPPSRSE